MAKTERAVFHVVLGERGRWNVKQEDTNRILGNHTARTQAILQGRDLALAQAYSLLVVFDREGKIEKQYNYGLKPS